MAAGRMTLSDKIRNYTNFSSTAREKNSHRAEERFSSVESRVQRGNVRLKIQSMGPICKTRRKICSGSSRISEQGYEEGNEGWPNHDEDSGMWLFSGSSSPSSCNCFDDKIFKNLLDFSLDDWLVSVFVLCKNSFSSPDHLSKATFFFDEILKEDDFLEEETTSWLMKSFLVDDEFPYSNEDRNYFDHSLYFGKRNFGLLENVEIQDEMFDPLVKLEDSESSEWISDDSQLNFLEMIDFPSSSHKSMWSYNISQLSDLVPSIGHAEEAEFTDIEKNRGNDDQDEPIFWPLVQKFDRSSEFSGDFFIMSPHKRKYDDEKLKGKLPEILIQNTGRDTGEKQKPWFNSAKVLEPQRSKEDDHILRDDNSANILIEDDMEVLDKHTPMFLEEDFLGVEELPIEQVIGLNEFDGLEGIDMEFKKDCFLLDGSF